MPAYRLSQLHSSLCYFTQACPIDGLHCSSIYTCTSLLKQFLDQCVCAADIRDVAVSVNDRLKKLIIQQDDEDYATDSNASSADSPTLSSRRSIASTSFSQQSQPSAGPTSTTTPTPARLTPSPSPSHPSTTTTTTTTGTSPGRETQDNTAATKTSLKPADSPKLGRGSPKMGRTVTKPVSQSTNATPKSESPVTGIKEEEGEEAEAGKEKEGGEEEIGAGRLEPRFHLLAVLGVLIPHMKYTLPETRMETLRWLMWLHQQLPKRVRGGGGWAVSKRERESEGGEGGQ